jgi:hypothetical protein
VAQATYTATTGVIDDVRILAGSPMTCGNVDFMIAVSLPDAPVLSDVSPVSRSEESVK